MSYTIVYDRRFVKTSRGIVPIILSGASNCTDFVKGREVLEREWNVYGFLNKVELPADVLLQEVSKRTPDPTSECFKWRSKWVLGKDYAGWYARGIKDAKSIEEIIAANAYQRLNCFLVVWQKGTNLRSSQELSAYVKTTPELEAWINQAYARRDEIGDEASVYICMRFNGRESLKSHPVATGAVVVKNGRNSYLTQYEKGKRLSFTANVGDAIVFSSVAEARECIGNCWKGLTFVKANTAAAPKPYAIKVEGGSWSQEYVKMRTSHKLNFAMTIDFAMRFATEKAALKYIESLKQSYPEKRLAGVYCVVKE